MNKIPSTLITNLKISSLEEVRLLLLGLASIKDNKTVTFVDLKRKLEMIEKNMREDRNYASVIAKAATDKRNTLGINGRRNVRR